MAVFVRCSCFFIRPFSLRPLPADHVAGNHHIPGNLMSLLSRVRNTGLSSGDHLGGQIGIPRLLPGSKAHLRLNNQKSDGNWDVNQVYMVQGKALEWLSALEGNQKLKFSTTAFLFTNAIMLTTPLEAWAETCEAENSFFNMPLLLLVALIGATVGGLLARQRRGELQRLNEQLRQINAALRRQAKIESYAPSLTYAPVGGKIPDNEVIVDQKKQELISRLKTGKNFLRNQEHEKAFMEFKTALELAQNLKDPIEEKKAARGLGASLQRQGKYREAVTYHSMVLQISEREGEDSGNTEAYGAIADCYTELGDLEKAGKFYDKYISRLEKD